MELNLGQFSYARHYAIVVIAKIFAIRHKLSTFCLFESDCEDFSEICKN